MFKKDRPRFIFTTIVIALLLFCLTSCKGISRNDAVRQRVSFDKGWLFARFGPMPDGSVKPEPEQSPNEANFDDSGWRRLNVPHDWAIEGPFRMDLHGNTGKLPWRGIGWYRKHFIVESGDKGKRTFIDFDGAMAYAEVWLNGNYIGQWPYGYASFRLELTDHLLYGQENVLAVKLDTTKWDARWYPGAGIYRHVWLVKTEPVHVAHWGVYITTPNITADKGDVQVEVTVDNQSDELQEVTVETDIYDQKENGWLGRWITGSGRQKLSIPANNSGTAKLQTSVNNPKLWDIENPNLYTAITMVSQDGKLVDLYETTIGFRTLEFTPRNGFLLNGKRVEVQGVCQHHDLGPLGAAMNTRALERQLEILKEMGCNAIRTSHNIPAPELIELANRMGFLVQVEAFDSWKKGKMPKDYCVLFDKWHKKDLQAMVRRDRSDPSVFMWSTGNEVGDQDKPEMSQKLTDIIKAEDRTRPVTVGCNWGSSGYYGFQKTMDVFGYNYFNKKNDKLYNLFLDFPDNAEIPLYGSETSSAVSSRGVYFFPVRREACQGSDLLADFQMCSYDQLPVRWGNTPDEQFEALDRYPAVFGEFVWTGFDYLGEPTPYNGDITNLLNFTDPVQKAELQKQLDEVGKVKAPSRSSYFGIVDLCGFPKDRFYLYQARWRKDLPMAHILPHWNWPERVGKVTPVHVYTSGDEAELFLNGKSLGKKKFGQYEYRLRWDDVVYQPGELKVIAYKDGKVWAEDTMKTTGAGAAVEMQADRNAISADGSDLSFVTVEVVDSDGLIVPRSENPINFEIEGPGEIIAVGNGDSASHEPFQAKQRKVFNGLCLVVIRSLENETGTIKLTASSQGLSGRSITIRTEN